MPDTRIRLPDKRILFWMDLEEEIQKRVPRKDPGFILSGRWKKFVREEGDFLIYAVDEVWVQTNLCAMFGHGGHGFVHEFIPAKPRPEIWIAIRHYTSLGGCECDNLKRKDQMVSKAFFDSTVLHEKTEFLEMAQGKNFFEADQIARQTEMRAGLLVDPSTEIDFPYPVLKSVKGKMTWV